MLHFLFQSVNNDIGFTEKQIKDYENKLESFNWLDNVEKLFTRYENVESRNSKLRQNINALKEKVTKYEELVDFVNNNDFSKAEKIIEKIENLSGKKLLLEEKIHNVSNDVSYIENAKIYPDFSKQEKVIEKLLNYKPDRQRVQKIKDDVYMYEIQKMHIENSAGDIRCLEEQLPAICPCCNRPIEKEGWHFVK